MLPNYLLRRITPAATKLYMVLFNSFDPSSEDPIIRVPVSTLARRSTFSPRSVWLTLAELETLHLIRRLPRDYHRANTYLLLPVPATPPTKPKTPPAPPDEQDILPLAQPTAHNTPITQRTPPLAQPIAHVDPPIAQPAAHDTPKTQSTPPLAQPAAHVPPKPPHTPLSILMNLYTGNLEALPPDVQQMPSNNLESYTEYLYFQLTPQEQALAIAAAQASLARLSPETTKEAQEVSHAK